MCVGAVNMICVKASYKGQQVFFLFEIYKAQSAFYGLYFGDRAQCSSSFSFHCIHCEEGLNAQSVMWPSDEFESIYGQVLATSVL